ncbi:type IV pilus modification PilV family protein [Piscirickettsia litoralis]|uniref:Type IV pilus modification protein PilV n=1 Tax=Piscirickettsia litoralis TaxID=1891921 RepID=A0ABX3A5X4_9GAMM|nr:hypothetical protein [Piscirickettsia litoralis]ODN42860.1 hypothetical protein BGC07_07905 [Piscirickettsia litoralis]
MADEQGTSLVEILIALMIISVMVMSAQVVSQLSMQSGQALMRQRALFLLADIAAEKKAVDRYSLNQMVALADWQQRVRQRLPFGGLFLYQHRFVMTWGKPVTGQITSCVQAHTSCLIVYA